MILHTLHCRHCVSFVVLLFRWNLVDDHYGQLGFSVISYICWELRTLHQCGAHHMWHLFVWLVSCVWWSFILYFGWDITSPIFIPGSMNFKVIAFVRNLYTWGYMWTGAYVYVEFWIQQFRECICCCFEGLFTQICIDVLMASCHDFMECHQITMFIFSKLSYPLNDKICLQES